MSFRTLGSDLDAVRLKPTIRRGGGEIIFNSARSGNFEVWAATRDEQSLV